MSSLDFFAQFEPGYKDEDEEEVISTEEALEVPEVPEVPEDEDYFAQFEPPEEEEITRPQPEGSEATRIAGELSMRGVEKIISGPREFGEFLESFVPEETLVKGAEKIGLGKGAQYLIDTTKKYAPYKLFPKEEQVRAFTKSLFGDLFEPKNELEEKAGIAFGEFASLVFPFLGKVPAKRAFLTSLGANAAKETGEKLGMPEEKSNLLKFGTYVLGSFLHPKWAQKFYRNRFDAADKALPQNARVGTSQLSSEINNLETQFTKGGVSSADRPALQQIQNIRNEMQGDVTPVDSLVAGKRKLNIERGNLIKQLEGNKPGIKTAYRNMNLVSKAIDKAIDVYAKYDRTWGKLYNEAKNSFAAVQNSQKASSFLKGKWPKIALSHAGLSALLGHFAGIKVAAATGGATIAAYPAYKGYQTLNMIMRSKPLRKEYLNLLQGAARGNMTEVSRSANALDKGLIELDK